MLIAKLFQTLFDNKHIMELIPTEQKYWAAMLLIYRNLVKPAFCALVFSFFILMRQSTRIITEAVTITAPPTPAPTPTPTAVPRETFGHCMLLLMH